MSGPAARIPGFDAREWVELWRKTITEHPDIPTDDDAMLTWFANAIMRGYDERQAVLERQRARAEKLEKDAERLRRLLEWTQGCVVRAAHALAVAAKGQGIDGADLFETAMGAVNGLMQVDAAITSGEPLAAGGAP